jgi:hypothetical protein
LKSSRSKRVRLELLGIGQNSDLGEQACKMKLALSYLATYPAVGHFETPVSVDCRGLLCHPTPTAGKPQDGSTNPPYFAPGFRSSMREIAILAKGLQVLDKYPALASSSAMSFREPRFAIDRIAVKLLGKCNHLAAYQSQLVLAAGQNRFPFIFMR